MNCFDYFFNYFPWGTISYNTDKFKLFFGVNGNNSEESIKEIPLSDVS